MTNVYHAADAPYKASDCKKTTTPCLSPSTQDIYHLEGHQVMCETGAALQTYELRECSNGGLSGYQYEYTCCIVQGMGGCELEFLPWADLTQKNPLVAVSQSTLVCEAEHV